VVGPNGHRPSVSPVGCVCENWEILVGVGGGCVGGGVWCSYFLGSS
jgi:hypothetical protein